MQVRRLAPQSVSPDEMESSLVAVPSDLPLPPATNQVEVLHLFRWFTHTCSEISYRITDVECISRAQTTQLKLTGMFGRFEVRNLSEVFLSTSLPEVLRVLMQLNTTVPSDNVNSNLVSKG